MERWGKEFHDDRDWNKYNKKSILRGQWFFDFSFLKSIPSELKEMNKDKVGRPYLYSDSFIEFESKLQPYFDYRSIQGICKSLSEKIKGFPVNNYTNICRRVNALELELPKIDLTKPVFVGNDGSGIKVSNRGEWMRQKWGTRRGWIKVDITMDVEEKKILAIDVSEEKSSEADLFGQHIDELTKKGVEIAKGCGDGAHDQRKLFNKFAEHKIEPVLKVRKNASTKARGSPARAREVRRYKELGYEEWARITKYGMRWATEGKFSSVKRKFGETVRSSKKANMLKEAKRKFILYERMMAYIA